MHESRDDWFPLDEAQHATQLQGLTALLDAGPILDLGCGDGRVLVPLTQAGFEVVGIDRDEQALARCAKRLGRLEARLLCADFLDHDWGDPRIDRFAAVLCLGNTFLLLHDVERAVELMRRLCGLLPPGGCVYLDAFCAEMWREVAEGNWQEGVSEDGEMQLLWAAGDNVIALREGEAADETCEEIGPDDKLYRLWTLGELRLLGGLCGLAGPKVLADYHLMRFVRL